MTPNYVDGKDRVSGDLYGFIGRKDARSIRVMITSTHALTPDRHEPIMYTVVTYGTGAELYYDGKTAEQSFR